MKLKSKKTVQENGIKTIAERELDIPIVEISGLILQIVKKYLEL